MSQMTQQEALETFEYKDGMLYWKKHVQANKYVGKPVGSVCNLGYYNTRHKNVNYKVHRIIFLMHNGYAPEVIDHIDGNPSNNKIENLREATPSLNKCNQVIYKSNTSGVKGVSWSSEQKRWKTQISFNGKRKYLGTFKVLSDAEEFVNLARDMIHGEFARVA
jgi:hypothetical protein